MADTRQFNGLRCAAILRSQSVKVTVVIRRMTADWSISICIDLHSNWQRFHFLSKDPRAFDFRLLREQSSRDDHVTFQKNLINEVAGGPLHVPGATWYGDTFRPQVEQLRKNFIDFQSRWITWPFHVPQSQTFQFNWHVIEFPLRGNPADEEMFSVNSDFCWNWLQKETLQLKIREIKHSWDDRLFICNWTRCSHFQMFNNTEMLRRLLSIRRNNSCFLELSWRPDLERYVALRSSEAVVTTQATPVALQ